jgi:hypothetical protein
MSILLNKLLLMMFHLLHISIIIFTVTGWIFPATRHAHLMMCVLIVASWFGVGAWKGWGYCLVTDIQWQLLRRLGKKAPPYSYVTMLLQHVTDHPVNAQRVDQMTEYVFYVVMVASLWVNWGWLRTLM